MSADYSKIYSVFTRETNPRFFKEIDLIARGENPQVNGVCYQNFRLVDFPVEFESEIREKIARALQSRDLAKQVDKDITELLQKAKK